MLKFAKKSRNKKCKLFDNKRRVFILVFAMFFFVAFVSKTKK